MHHAERGEIKKTQKLIMRNESNFIDFHLKFFHPAQVSMIARRQMLKII
jgi:hypothetical protein